MYHDIHILCVDCMRKLDGLAQDEGNDVGYKGKLPIRLCLDHCILNEGCKSISYDEKNLNCYLKDKRVDASTPKRYNTHYRTYYKTCDGNDKTSDISEFSILNNVESKFFLIIYKLSIQFADLDLPCIVGKGNTDEMLKEIRSISLQSCKVECFQETKCVAIDFSNTGEFRDSSSCRIFDTAKMNTDSGLTDHTFCAKSKCQTTQKIHML